MRWAVCRAQADALVGDTGALAMSFALPVAVFLIFATIFSSASGDQMRVTVAVADAAGSPLSRRLVTAIGRDPQLDVVLAGSAAAAEERVTRGAADAAVVIRRDGRALDTLAGEGPPPVLVLSHPARTVAGSVAAGAVQRAYFAALPDAALRGAVALVDELVVPLTPEQRATATATLDALAADAATDAPDAGAATFSSLVETTVSRAGEAAASVPAYYAAAVAALFVLLAAVPIAAGMHEIVASGGADRALAGPAGSAVLVDGRALFVVLQGMVQTGLIFAASWLRAGVMPSGQLVAWALVSLSLSVAAAGLVLSLSAACATSRQAVTFGNVAVLITAAVGGSMVPRFLMPGWLQDAGWATPNAWAIHGFDAATRGAGGWPDAMLAAAVLLTVGALGVLLARRLLTRRVVI